MAATRKHLLFALVLIVLSSCKLEFDPSDNGAILEPNLGFECTDFCTFDTPEDFAGNYVATPAPNYRFSGWSGDACNSPKRRLETVCPVIVNPALAALDLTLRLEAEFTRKANLSAIQNTPQFKISNFGFGGFYTNEQPPQTCYPDINSCYAPGTSWIHPHNYATGDFNNDGRQDLLVQVFTRTGYVRIRPGPVVFLNDGQGGLYRSDDIFKNGQSENTLGVSRFGVADFNGDGKDDFVQGAYGQLSREPHNYLEKFPARIPLYLSGPGNRLYDASGQIAGQENGGLIPSFEFAHELSIGDIDCDGDQDFFQGGHLFINDGSGSFSLGQMPQGFELGYSFVMSSLIDDYDGDGIGDLLVNYAKGAEGSLSRLFLSEGKASMASRTAKPMPEGYFGFMNTKHNHASSADIDGDGDLDIVIGQTRNDPYYAGRAVQILINDGTGNFADQTDQRVSQADVTDPESGSWGEGYVHLLDVNGDGYIDIFDRNGTTPVLWDGQVRDHGVDIWLNDGSGRFTHVPQTVFPYVQPKDLMGPKYALTRFGPLWEAAPIDLDGQAGIDIVTFVVTSTPPTGGFGESTLYTLTSKKKLQASDLQ